MSQSTETEYCNNYVITYFSSENSHRLYVYVAHILILQVCTQGDIFSINYPAETSQY